MAKEIEWYLFKCRNMGVGQGWAFNSWMVENHVFLSSYSKIFIPILASNKDQIKHSGQNATLGLHWWSKNVYSAGKAWNAHLYSWVLLTRNLERINGVLLNWFLLICVGRHHCLGRKSVGGKISQGLWNGSWP